MDIHCVLYITLAYICTQQINVLHAVSNLHMHIRRPFHINIIMCFALLLFTHLRLNVTQDKVGPILHQVYPTPIPSNSYVLEKGCTHVGVLDPSAGTEAAFSA